MAPVASADTGCVIRELASVPASYERGMVVIPASINGVEGHFVIDTASEISQISESFAARLHLDVSEARGQVSTTSGTYHPRRARISELKIGKMTASFGILITMPAFNDGTPQEIDGAISQDYLGQLDMELDPAGKAFKLFEPSECGGRSVYWWDDHFELDVGNVNSRPVVEVAIDGYPLHAYLATSNDRSDIDSGVAKERLGVPTDLSVPTVQEGSGKAAPGMPYTFKSLAFGAITLRNPKIDLLRYRNEEISGATHIRQSVANVTPVHIGMDVLGKIHSLISVRTGKMYFTLANERKPQAAAVAAP